MSKKFTEYSKFDLSNVNKEVLKKWKDGDIFHKSLETREGHPTFVFYEGPPSASGVILSDRNLLTDIFLCDAQSLLHA